MNLLRRVAALFRRSSIDREIDEELQAHLAMRAENNVAAGMSPEAAARDARLRFGNPTATRERVEHVDVALTVDSVWRDIRYAIRGYVNAPMLAIVAITTLALGFVVIDAQLGKASLYTGANGLTELSDNARSVISALQQERQQVAADNATMTPTSGMGGTGISAAQIGRAHV